MSNKITPPPLFEFITEYVIQNATKLLFGPPRFRALQTIVIFCSNLGNETRKKTCFFPFPRFPEHFQMWLINFFGTVSDTLNT